jgi:hypothetical protein
MFNKFMRIQHGYGKTSTRRWYNVAFYSNQEPTGRRGLTGSNDKEAVRLTHINLAVLRQINSRWLLDHLLTYIYKAFQIFLKCSKYFCQFASRLPPPSPFEILNLYFRKKEAYLSQYSQGFSNPYREEEN